MSNPQEIPSATVKASSAGTPIGSPKSDFLIPSPIPTRRTRTYSQSERAKAGPVLHGHIKSFCRQKGHGFIIPKDNGEPIFAHISDVEGELVPREGDEVTYKLCAMPPKFEKFCAVHVVIVNPRSDVPHDHWAAFSPHHDYESSMESPTHN